MSDDDMEIEDLVFDQWFAAQVKAYAAEVAGKGRFESAFFWVVSLASSRRS